MLSRHLVKINLATSEIKHITYQGAPHLVVPTVMLIPGVHNGSSGPILYETDEIRASAPNWNGRPVTLGHPTSGSQPVSVYSSPEVFERSLGTVWNARMENNKLKANLYLHEQRTQQLAPQLMQALKSGRKIEVSTGLFSRDQRTSGVWNNEKYVAVVRNIQPDHLAVLLDQVGACSWEDGCGIRVNASTSPTTNINEMLHFYGFRQGGTTMREQEPLMLPVLNWTEDKEKKQCPCAKPCGKGNQPNNSHNGPEVLDLPRLV